MNVIWMLVMNTIQLVRKYSCKFIVHFHHSKNKQHTTHKPLILKCQILNLLVMANYQPLISTRVNQRLWAQGTKLIPIVWSTNKAVL